MSPEVSDLFYRCVHMLHGNFKLDRQHAGSIIASLCQNYDLPEGVFIGPLSAQPEEVGDLLKHQPGLGLRLLDPTKVTAVGIDVGNLSFARVGSSEREIQIDLRDIQFFNTGHKTPIAKHVFTEERVISGRVTEESWVNLVKGWAPYEQNRLLRVKLVYKDRPDQFFVENDEERGMISFADRAFLAMDDDMLIDKLIDIQCYLSAKDRADLKSVVIETFLGTAEDEELTITPHPEVVENSVGEQRATLYLKNLGILNEALRDITLQNRQIE